MVKFIKIFNIILAIALLISFGFILGKRYDVMIDSENNISVVQQSANEQKLKKIFNLIDAQYIKDVDSDSMVDATLNYVLQGLDPHSVYLTSEQNKLVSDVSGEFEGLGVEFEIFSDTLTVVRSLEGSPNSGHFVPGDKFVKINNVKIVGLPSSSIKQILDNVDNYKIQIQRNGKLKNVVVDRETIPLKSVPVAYEIKPGVGYIRLAHFSKNAHSEVVKSIKSFKNKGVSSIILDLRFNGGGLLEEAEKIADEFLPANETIYYLQNEKDKKKNYHYATGSGNYETGKLYVLINEHSASASEVLTGALQDNKRAVILGRRSFGKALVQREIQLNDGSTIRITTAKYYTPSGRSIQKDYSNVKDYESEINNRLYSGELYDEEKMKIADSTTHKNANGTRTHGNGGIIPDIFVPLSTYDFGRNFDDYGLQLIRKSVVYDIGKHMPEYYSITEDDFIKDYEPKRFYQELYQSLKNQGVDVDEDNEVLKQFTKAFIGKLVYGEDAYYKIWNEEDEMVQKAVELSQKK